MTMNRLSTASPNSARWFLRRRSQASFHNDVPCSASLIDVMVSVVIQWLPNWVRSRGFIQAARISDSRLNRTMRVERKTVVPRIMV